MEKVDKNLAYVYCRCIDDILRWSECDQCPHYEKEECQYEKPAAEGD